MSVPTVILILILACGCNGQTIKPTRDEDPGSAPQYLTLIMDRAKSDTPAPNLDPRISAKQIVEKTSVDLEISFAEVTDSALYYCALQPTVTGNLHMQYKNLT
ncbi:hypothetical protein DPEC_G00370400 [Dallia pectoralis]|nr:hypothetical protein DPEC_G00370400 [Dallia pectoralis]